MTDSDSAYIPPELLREILLKLPTKSLIRFIVVCKLWLSLITSSPFISAHLAQTPHSNTLLVRRYIDTCNKENYSLFQDSKNQPFSLDSISKLNFPFKCQREYYEIVGSCNGIMCLSGKLFGKLWSLVLWNPSIQKFITLPRPSIKPKSPHKSVFGFGADLPQTNDYKLVRLVYHKNDVFGYNKYNGFPEIEIYSINSGVWRRVVGFEIKHSIVEIMSSHAFVEGFVHWIVYDYVANGGCRRISIMTFSIADEVFGEIMLPDAIIGGPTTGLSVTLFEESLAVVRYGMGMGMYDYFCEVWVMKQYGVLESWSRLCHINLVAGFKKVVGFRNNGEVLISTRENVLVSYDPNSRRSTSLGIEGYTWSFYVQNYMESLILLKGNNVIPGGFLGGMGGLWT